MSQSEQMGKMEKNCSQGLGEECSIKDKVELNRRAIKDKAEAVDTVEYHMKSIRVCGRFCMGQNNGGVFRIIRILETEA